MILEVGKIYYETGHFGDESITITLDNKTKFPDRSLNAISYVLEGDHAGMGRMNDCVRIMDVSVHSSWVELTDKSKIYYLQKMAIMSTFERGVKKGR